MTASAEAIGHARNRFAEEHDAYEAAGESIAAEIAAASRQQGITCRATSRAKSVASFVGKCWRKGYDTPWEQVTDKVGVRVICDVVTDIEQVAALVHEKFQVTADEDKTQALVDADKIGYAGRHIQVVIPGIVGGECEIQVRTAAMDLWSDMSHRLVYKPNVDIDKDTRRALVRLQTLTEIFDEEVSRAMKQIASDPANLYVDLIGFASEIFYRHNESEIDSQLSKFVLGEIGPTIGIPPAEYGTQLEAFGARFESKLSSIFQRYQGNFESILLHQPESIIIFERIETATLSIEATWPESLPRNELEMLANIWGANLGD